MKIWLTDVMRLSGITPESIVDGPGLRYVIFAQGCLHHCPHCQNQKTWDLNAGKEYTVRQVIRLFKKQKTTAIRGVTFSGGDPFLQAGELAQAAQAARQLGWDIVTYTGYTYEQLIGKNNNDINNLLAAIDILIDGRYIHELRTADLPYRGSSNQRMINMPETLKTGQIILLDL